MSCACSRFDAPSELVGTVRACPSYAKKGNTPLTVYHDGS